MEGLTGSATNSFSITFAESIVLSALTYQGAATPLLLRLSIIFL